MPFISNIEIARLIEDVAAAYEVKPEYRSDSRNKFRIQKLNEMASNIMNLNEDLYSTFNQVKLPGIGKNTIEYLEELFRTGTVKHYEEIKSGLPTVFFELSRIITPIQANRIINNFNIKSFQEAQDLTEEDLEELFPQKVSKEIKNLLTKNETKKKLFLLPEMIYLSNKLLEHISTDENITRLETCGSIRRRKAVIKDIDIVIETKNLSKTKTHILKYPELIEKVNQGDDWTIIKIKYKSFAVAVDIRMVTVQSNEYISLLHHLTGSKLHNIHLREIAKRMGYSISEHGIKNVKTSNVFKAKTEKEFFDYLKLPYIPPELREDSGFELTEEIPKRLIELSDIKGDLHIHSSYQIQSSHDYGDSTIDELANMAVELGYEYIGISDHNPKQSLTSDEMIQILKERKKLIDKAQKKYDIRIYNMLEVDIKPDGTLAIDKQVEDYLDFFIVSIHSSFDLDVKPQTERILKALSHSKAKIFGHPLTRILPDVRGEILVEWEKVFKFCNKNNKYLEINTSPQRTDLSFELIFDGLNYGCKYIINSDTHAIEAMNSMIYGVFNARRGWCSKDDVVNCLPLKSFEKLIL